MPLKPTAGPNLRRQNSEAIRTLTVDLGEISVPVTLRGSGPAILPVPGGAVGCGGFPDIVEMLEGSGTVILHDRVGTGRTPFREGGPDTLAKQADDLRRVIEAAGRGPAVILAQSFGGPVSVQLAVDHSEVVAGLVLLDISPFNDARIMGSMRHYRSMPRLFENRLVNPVYKAVVRRIIKSKLKSRKSTPALERAIEEMLDTAQLRSLAALTLDIAHQAARLHHRLISNPCSIKGVTVTADRKQGHSVRRAHEQIAQMTGTKFEMWEGTSHVLHLERPERVAAAVLQVLA